MACACRSDISEMFSEKGGTVHIMKIDREKMETESSNRQV